MSGQNIINENYQSTQHEEVTEIPEEHKDILVDKGSLETIQKFELIKVEIEKQQRPHTAWQIIEVFMEIVASQDPSWFHFDIARKVLEHENPEAMRDQTPIDILARELVESCNRLKALVPCPKEFKYIKEKHKKEDKKRTGVNQMSPLEILEYSESDMAFENIFLKESLLLWDREYINLIANTGKHGKNIAEKLPNNLRKRYENGKLLSFWFEAIDHTERTYFFHSAAFIILGEVLWKDIVKPKWERQTKNTPALAKGVLITTIKPPLSKDTRIEVNPTGITCYSEEGKIISSVPCVDPKLLSLVCKGMESFSSLTGHKLLRWQVQTGFNNWVQRAEDPRLICTTGGYEGIANLIGCGGSKKSPAEVKAILHAQAFGYFNFPQGGTGNMIILREIEKHRNGEPSKINIILGEMLLPNFTHILPPGEKRRLVPITELPPLIGSKNTHASQAMLQLLILEEFSNQSDRLASIGSVFIPIEKWKELAKQAKLPESCISRVIDGWTYDDLFIKAFLQKQDDEYRLGPNYSLVMDFLEYQGKQRVEGARGGNKSAQVRKGLVNQKYSTKKKSS